MEYSPNSKKYDIVPIQNEDNIALIFNNIDIRKILRYNWIRKK